MRLHAHHRLFASYGLLVAAVTVALVLGLEATLRGPLVRQAAEELTREVLLAGEVFDLSGGDADSLARELSASTGHRVTIIAPDGRVIGDSGARPDVLAALENHAARPEVAEALERGTGADVRRSASVNRNLVYAAARTGRGPVIRLAAGVETIDRTVARVRRQIMTVGALALLLAAAFSLLFSFAITRPLRHLRGIATSMAAGDLSPRVRTARTDELGEMGVALDRLGDELQRRLAELTGEREEMAALIDAMAEGVVALDGTGAVARTNPAAREIFALGVDPVGMPPEAVARRPEFLSIVRRVRAGETVGPTEFAYDGRVLLGNGHPLREGGAVLVFLDVSRLRRLETARREFVANASHELKTPLTAIRGFAETLAEEDLPDDLRRQFTATLQANAERLQRLVDDLLDLSRIESGGWRIHPEHLSIGDAARAGWEAIAAAQRAEVGFRLEVAPGASTARADASGLQQIFTNLLANAVRHTPPGGQIVVRSERDRSGDWVRVSVRDTGSGIPAAHLPLIFERFHRVDAGRSRAAGGTGLGLAIVKHLVEVHGGTVGAESELGRGTTVWFTLPAVQEGGVDSET